MFYQNKTLTSMHKLHQRSLPLDPTGIILETCCNSSGVIQTVCVIQTACLYKIDPHDEGIPYLVPRSTQWSNLISLSLSGDSVPTCELNPFCV